jgi:hypothetical protein
VSSQTSLGSLPPTDDVADVFERFGVPTRLD